jgi:hypothetical protein
MRTGLLAAIGALLLGAAFPAAATATSVRIELSNAQGALDDAYLYYNGGAGVGQLGPLIAGSSVTIELTDIGPLDAIDDFAFIGVTTDADSVRHLVLGYTELEYPFGSFAEVFGAGTDEEALIDAVLAGDLGALAPFAALLFDAAFAGAPADDALAIDDRDRDGTHYADLVSYSVAQTFGSIVITPVPEPTTVALLAAGSVAAAWTRRRKHGAAAGAVT